MTEKKHREASIWGPLRFGLGVLQLTYAPLALYVLVTHWISELSTWLLLTFTTSVTVVSRLLYWGAEEPFRMK